MTILLIVLAVLVIGAAIVFVARKGWFSPFYGNTITKMVERQKRVDGEVEVLKKQQKVESETVAKEFADRKTTICDAIDANIQALQAQISSLKEQKKTKCKLLDEKMKVTLDKVINEFDHKIMVKANQSKRLTHLIGAEKLNMDDMLFHEDPSSPQLVSHQSMGFHPEETRKNNTKKTSK